MHSLCSIGMAGWYWEIPLPVYMGVILESINVHREIPHPHFQAPGRHAYLKSRLENAQYEVQIVFQS